MNQKLDDKLLQQLIDEQVAEASFKQMATAALASTAIAGASFGAGHSVAQHKPIVKHSMHMDNKLSDVLTKDFYETLKKHEGVRNSVYRCSQGYPTVGVGFNLDRKDAKDKLRKVGLDINQVLRGKKLTDEQIQELFYQDVQTAVQDAEKYVQNLHELPVEVQQVVINMSFNLGYPVLSKFTGLKKALESGDFAQAAEEMKNSRWFKQTGDRSKQLYFIMKEA